MLRGIELAPTVEDILATFRASRLTARASPSCESRPDLSDSVLGTDSGIFAATFGGARSTSKSCGRKSCAMPCAERFLARRYESARRLRCPVDGSLTQVNGLTGDAWQSVPTGLPGGSGSAVEPWSEYEAIEPQVAEAKNDAAHRGTRPRGSHLDPHQPQQKPHDNTVCPQCRAVYRDRRGRWTMEPKVPRRSCAAGVRYGAAALHRNR